MQIPPRQGKVAPWYLHVWLYPKDAICAAPLQQGKQESQ